MTGLFWFNADSYNSVLKAKHSCEQGDDFSKFSWTKYDPRYGGREVIKDNENKVDLTFDFVKSYNLKNSEDQSWGLKIRGKPKKGFENVKTGIVFYAGLEITDPSSGEILTITNVDKKPNGYGHGDVIELSGYSQDLKQFSIKINDGPEKNRHVEVSKAQIPDNRYNPALTKHIELTVPENNIWQARNIFISLLQESLENLNNRFKDGDIPQNLDVLPPAIGLTLPNLNNYEGNLHFIEKLFEGEFEFDVVFNSYNSKNSAPDFDPITFDNLSAKIKNVIAKFNTKFDKIFQFRPPFTAKQYKKFGQDFVSNLIGGVGYFHGNHLVDRQTQIDEEGDDEIGKFKKLVGSPEGPFSLFTSVPSRPFFPRGFYWDEGFHLIPILEYDFDLALEILKSWFDLIDDDGWIAREQILGNEARSKVPEDFQVQNPNIANPPTLMLAFIDILTKASNQKKQQFNFPDLDTPQEIEDFGAIRGNNKNITTDTVSSFHLEHPELLIEYARQIYPKIKKHYEWFRRTQKGEIEEFERSPYSLDEAYRWIGRTEKLCLPSGLDDYPRADVPDVGELHVDLISWVGSFTASMRQFAELLGYKEDYEKYDKILNDIIHNINDLHWSEKDKAYCDVTLDYSDEDIFVCHKGYVTLFPFLLKLVPHDSDHILHVLKLIADPEQLFSPYGIRSLSKQDPYFRQGEDYWRGKVWINVNYLILDSLLYYSEEKDGKSISPETKQLASQLYQDLRVNIVNNVFDKYKKTGYAWENYDESDGSPTGVRHFLGWTSLVVMIMKMPETI